MQKSGSSHIPNNDRKVPPSTHTVSRCTPDQEAQRMYTYHSAVLAGVAKFFLADYLNNKEKLKEVAGIFVTNSTWPVNSELNGNV